MGKLSSKKKYKWKTHVLLRNKNDNTHKTKLKKSDDQTNIDKLE